MLSDAALRESEERLRLALEAAGMGTWDFYPQTDVLRWDARCKALFGLPADAEVDYGVFLAGLHPDDRERTHQAVQRALDPASGGAYAIEHRTVGLKDGIERTLSAQGRAHFDDAGRPVRFIGTILDVGDRERVGVHTDITERKQAEEERERLIRNLERTNRELDEFAYVASHDLKAPLRGIANLAQWIEEDLADRMTEDASEMMSLLRGRVHRLEGLIDGILSYSRAGRVRHATERIDVGALLAGVIELLAPPEGSAIRVAPGMPVIESEHVPLEQVFMNLIGNALKHANRSDVVVEVSARDAGAHWEFAIADNGPGIRPEYQERIWGIFQTLAARDRVEGTGIGLSVVKKLVEMRGGRAWVESSEGAGATFRFTWLKRPAGES